MSFSTDPQQEAIILRAICISSSATYQGQIISSHDRQSAFQILKEFQSYPGRIPLCLKWLNETTTTTNSITNNTTTTANNANNANNTRTQEEEVAVKLFACEQIQEFCKHKYSQLPENERLQARTAILSAARDLCLQTSTQQISYSAARILSNKYASLLAAIMVRDFPQRWTSCIEDLFGTLWGCCNNNGSSINNNENNNNNNLLGIKMCLEIMKLVAEDCTDSDFNSKISTKRRNDVLIGLNEVSSRFLPYLFGALERISTLQQAKIQLHQMHEYLFQNGIKIQQMTPEQQVAYQVQNNIVQTSATVIVDTLITLEHFCRSMPLEWIIPSSTTTNSNTQQQQQDFAAALFFLIREPTDSIQILALSCIEQLCLRGKLTYEQWMGWIQELPNTIQQANQQLAAEQEYLKLKSQVGGVDNNDINNIDDPMTQLTVRYDFHRSLSRTLATLINSHLSHIAVYKYILKQEGKEYHAFFNFLRLLVDMCKHPSGRVAWEQMSLWISLLRDPQLSKSKVLQPFVAELMDCYINHMARIRWEDVDEQTHPQYKLIDVTFDDEDEYDIWLGDYRSKASQLYKLFGIYAPDIASSTLCNRLKATLATHGSGEPRDHLDPKSQQLTQASEAVRQLEGLVQPVDNILFGIPTWAIIQPAGETVGNRATIRAQTQASLSELANMIVVAWNPTYLWLRFRRAQLLEALKHYWKDDPTTLLQGIDSLLKYIGVPDEWATDTIEADGTKRTSDETVGLRKKSSMALVSVGRKVPHHLVQYLSQLGDAAQALLASPQLNSTNRMHVYEFLSSVATAVEDSSQRANFVATILSEATTTLKSQECQEAIASLEGFLSSVGVSQAGQNPASVTDIQNVKATTGRFQRLFSAINQLHSVAKRCHEAAKKRPNGGIPVTSATQNAAVPINNNNTFPDEGPVSLRDLSIDDPFIPLWPQILPDLLKVTDALLRLWRPEHQAIFLRDRIQRYALAISDDEAYLSKKTDNKDGGVFGEGGTAGSIIPGTDRRDMNLAARWSAWFNELRNTCLQMLGLVAAQRVIFAPEVSEIYPRFVAVVSDPENLRSMEHRHFTQYLKQFMEVIILSCPTTMYMTHLAPVICPVFEHLQYRLEKTWEPVIQNNGTIKPVTTRDCEAAAALASRGGDEWFRSYYARSGLFVGDLDAATSESAVEKGRVELTRTFSDVLQSALALKGDWALVLANLAREEQAAKQSNSSNKGNKGPPNRLADSRPQNADGTPKSKNQDAIDARKIARISAMCHFLFLEHEQIAGFLTLIVIQCLEYPDAYTCRRITRICHRILETAAWYDRYTELLGSRMLTTAIKNIVLEPKWMVGVEWEMINVVRDIYGRISLGQIVQPGGQGAGLQQPFASRNPIVYEQAKTADKPLQGGGILTTPSDIPRQVMASLPGISAQMIQQMDTDLKTKRSAKDQKDIIRDLLRIAADNWNEAHPTNNLLDRAVEQESLLHSAHRKADVEDIPEKLVTQSTITRKRTGHNKKGKKKSTHEGGVLDNFKLMS